MKSTVVHFAQGLLMGGSDAIPGVSGGTMALIVGIYRRLIDAISQFVSLVLATVRGNAEKRREYFRAVDWGLVIPLGVGVVTAFAVAAVVIPVLLERYPEQMRGLFFGLVAASVAIPWLRIRTTRAWYVALAAGFGVLAYLLVSLPQGSMEDPSLVRIFFSTSVAICAMILPGVSGAYLLHALGVYEATFRHIGNLDVVYGLAFAGGAVFGLGAFSKVLDWLLERYHDATMAALTGLMAGGLRALWPWLNEETRTLHLPDAGDPIWSVVALGTGGFLFITAIAWLGSEELDEEAGDPNPAEGKDAAGGNAANGNAANGNATRSQRQEPTA